MLNVQDITISFLGEDLFSGISFKLNGGDKIGLIGKNGAGKSTLLKVISGELEPDGGQIAVEKDIKVGFLKQDIDFEFGFTVLEEAYKAFSEIRHMERQLEMITHQLAERTDYESEDYHQLMVDLNDIQHRYEVLGGYHYQGDTEKVLIGLGFKPEDFNQPTETFSGGWRMRIELAKILLQNNDVLLLDEPTNHLDIESIIWFENFLKTYPGAVVMVSHDKRFLDNVTNRTIEISLGRIYDVKKSYSKFLAYRREIRDQQMAAQKNQEKQIEQTEKLIEKFRAKASKASMAQSLIKKLDKIDRIEVDEEDNAVMTLKFPVSIIPGKVVIEAHNISKSYGDNHVLSQVDLHVNRDSKIAFVGQNGQGKSTLAKIIVGELKHKGNLKLGHNVQIGYFAQNQADYLDGNKTILDTMIDAANETNRTKVRDILGAFLFRGDEVDKYVKVLSGGERNRLALAKMLLQPFNVLVMDEPTNHLDIASKNVLKKALEKFQGTLILVSHDRDFLSGLTDLVYEFRNREIKEYLGNIDDYLASRDVDNLREIEKREKVEVGKAKADKNDYELQKKLKSLNNRLSKIEKEIQDLEAEIKKTDQELEIKYVEITSKPNFFEGYQQKKKKLENLMKDWENLQLQMEELGG
ncbi:ABC-F family ATP-binding cassette domain-containing protein [Aegicerativicinus sediminis]|uniref:ABC-F family ATP-binding cassette domain-containing protein n=1 Tax=Aegicerativicinus sediminis TaxID=2893202 RepID=UPI001E63C7E6|nr:ABC-F family ATP-binding cassette domain-containing protein [Aegicerativicinus sediminis]